MFLAEGEEIMGSPSYNNFVKQYSHRLKNVKASYCPVHSQNAQGGVGLGLGLKGMVVVELTSAGKTWQGAPATTIHSSAASLVHSPPFRLTQALATLTKPDGSGCAVKGLQEIWDYRKPLSNEEKSLLEALVEITAERDWRDVLPVGGKDNVDGLFGGTKGIDPLINWNYAVVEMS